MATLAQEIQLYLFQWDGPNLGKQFNDRWNQYFKEDTKY